MSEVIGQTVEYVAPPGICRLDDIFCGCGHSYDAWKVVLDALEWFDTPHADRKVGEETRSGYWHIVASLLNHLDLIEHGSSLFGGWTTEDGKESLVFLHTFGHDWKQSDSAIVDFEDHEFLRAGWPKPIKRVDIVEEGGRSHLRFCGPTIGGKTCYWQSEDSVESLSEHGPDWLTRAIRSMANYAAFELEKLLRQGPGAEN